VKSLYVQITRQQKKLFRKLEMLLVLLLAWSGAASSQTWVPLTRTPQFAVGTALQLTDGTIMVQENRTSNWWRLKPDKWAHYATGTWSPMKSMPTGYAPTYFASAVLPDGRVIIEGGEYNMGKKHETNMGAIYDPFTDGWASVSPPTGIAWAKIGDAQSVVLPDGTFMLGNCCSAQAALLDATTWPLTWTVLNSSSGYLDKFDSNSEEGWTLLPDGNVLTVDTHGGKIGDTASHSEIYDPGAGKWSSAGSTVVQLWDSRAACGGTKSTHEIGPAVLRPDGKVFATGANTCPSSAGHTAIYDTKSRIWTAGPDVPGVNDAADASASILPDGNVLLDTNPGWGHSPSTFYEYAYDGTGWVNIPQPMGLNSNTEGGRMLITPEGSVLFLHVNTTQVWVYKPAGTYQKEWQPTICPSCYPAECFVGETYMVSGTQFNGLTQGAAFGDDAQSATNFPLVQITNNKTGHKFFARTHNFSTMAVATGGTVTSTLFDILPTSSGTEFGDSTMVVIANGIPSDPVGIIVKQ
jgi:hypothetical protein